MKNQLLVVWYAVLFATVVIIDQITKYWALTSLPPEGYQVNNFLSFDLVFNRGISWGLFNGHNTYAFVLVTSLVGVIILFLMVHALISYYHSHPISGHILALAGACSNMFDRLWYGSVIDFILFSWGNWSWPVFNVADIAIVIGLLYMIIRLRK